MTAPDDDSLLTIPEVSVKRGGIQYSDGQQAKPAPRRRWWRRPWAQVAPWISTGITLAAALYAIRPPIIVNGAIALVAMLACFGVLLYVDDVLTPDRPRLRERMRIRAAGVRHILRRVTVRWRWYDVWVGAYFGPGEVFVCPIPCLCISYRWGDTRPLIELSWGEPMRIRAAGWTADHVVIEQASLDDHDQMTLVLRQRSVDSPW